MIESQIELHLKAEIKRLDAELAAVKQDRGIAGRLIKKGLGNDQG